MPSQMHTYPMAVPRDPTTAEIAQFLVTRSGDQMSQLVQALTTPAAQAALTRSMLLLPPKVTPKVAPPEKAKKALNAFVGFRCYYIQIPALKAWPMKKISSLMGIMWEKDPNKSIWSLLAKAWSAIRDTLGTGQAPLDQFFRLMCPHLNLPSPATYLAFCGWELKVNAEGNPVLSKDNPPLLNSTSAGIAGMALSVQDIIGYCHDMGYAENFTLNSKTHSPTFLAQSYKGKSVAVRSQTHLASTVHDDRLAVRDQRRVRKQAVRATSAAQALHQQIADTHNTTDMDVDTDDASITGQNEPAQFYDQLADLLTDNLGQDQQGTAGASSTLAVTSSDLAGASNDFTGASSVSTGASSDNFTDVSSHVLAGAPTDTFTGVSADMFTGASADIFTGASANIFTSASADIFSGASTEIFAGASTDLGVGTSTDLGVGTSADLSAGEDPTMNDWNDWGAFRLGADEDATLPSFDLATL
uniref:Mating-type protein MAT-1 n=1 Tax=Stagonosporopsis tanaceti TaxID=1200839 RepID=A0A023ZRZ8_9PLEO|nr:MAT1-1-1 mating-type protein [Stagonosporopsis tanaceti]AIT18256.1 MAT1-1-1 mating type protein [Stagonosporopsis tanaceti]